jgi:hypothetical protein
LARQRGEKTARQPWQKRRGSKEKGGGHGRRIIPGGPGVA